MFVSNRISSRDTGKTMVDASLGEIMTTCEKITWLLAEGERWLKPEYRLNLLFIVYSSLIFVFVYISVFHYQCKMLNCLQSYTF